MSLLSLLPLQTPIVLNPTRYKIIVAGRRFGKTYIALRNAHINPRYGIWAHRNYKCWYLAPTIGQGREIAWEPLRSIASSTPGLIRKINETRMEIVYCNGSTIRILGTDKEDHLLGSGLNFVILDEFSIMKKHVWTKIVRPMLSDTLGGAMFTGTPRGYNHLYDIFQKGNDEKFKKSYQSWLFMTKDNPYIPAQEIEDARNELDEKTFRQEYEASFENMSGRVYYAFDRKLHVKPHKFNIGMPIVLTTDFGTVTMQWALSHYINGKLCVFDEIVKFDTNTEEMAKAVKAKYPSSFFYVYGDYAGNTKQSSSRTTDFDIIQNILQNCTIRTKPHSPVIDRINALNAMIKSASGLIRFEVDPICKYVIEDLEQTVYLDGTNNREIDKKHDKLRTHVSDGLSYYPDYEHSLKGKPRSNIS